MRRLNGTNVMPPGGFRYFAGETATWVPQMNRESFTAFADLENAVRLHYRANGIPIPPNLSDLIQDQICQRIRDPQWCNEDGHVLTEQQTLSRRRGFKAFSFAEVKSFSSTMADWFLHGKRRVSDAEITSRAEVCLRCPLHLDPVGCVPCNKGSLTAIAQRVISGNPHPLDSSLRSCAACGCLMTIKTRIPTDILLRNMNEEVVARLHPKCWLKKQEEIPNA